MKEKINNKGNKMKKVRMTKEETEITQKVFDECMNAVYGWDQPQLWNQPQLEVNKMKAKSEGKEMKEKEYVLGKKITDGKYAGTILYNDPRNLPEATEEDLKDENIYTIEENIYNNNKKILIWNYDVARQQVKENSRSSYNAYSSMYGLTRMMIKDTIERCEEFISDVRQYDKDISICAEMVKDSLENALQELNKTIEQQNKICHVFDGR